MCTGRLQAPSRAPSATMLFVAKLRGYDLRFHKRSSDGSGKADAYKTNNETHEVWGVVFCINNSEERNLDGAEGLGNGYLKGEVDMLDEKNVPHKVWIYCADNSYIDSSLKPYCWYKRFVVEGARQHGLPKSYINALRNVKCIKDPNKNRNARERSILC
ncbi:MAG: gamma-glutamylcyclotransferase [Candidatus Marinimicrobia bacterium]|nr:gamma-glutamylcyclotransferase [Candidatus Neomarinimicrobiota bacterium]